MCSVIGQTMKVLVIVIFFVQETYTSSAYLLTATMILGVVVSRVIGAALGASVLALGYSK